MLYQAVTKAEDVQKSFEALRAGFCSGTTVFADRAVGFQGGAHRCTVYWHGSYKFWGLFEENIADGRYWICFGQDNPAKTQILTITVEINPPKEGINRRCAGVFVRDTAGRTYIAHSGKIGGGRKGIGKEAFRDFSANDLLAGVAWPDGKQTSLLVIGEIGADSVRKSLSRFVNLVGEFKKSVISGAGSRREGIGSQRHGKAKLESTMTFAELLMKLLEENPAGLTPQQIREMIRTNYQDFYGTDSHKRNVDKGHYKDLDHALLAQIYSTASNSRRITADRTQKPALLTLGETIGASEGVVRRPPRVGRPNKARKRAKTAQLQDMATPTPSLVKKYLTKWEELENYQLQDKSLKLLFHTLCPSNKAIEHVLLKVSALNDFYSTNIYNTYAVAKHIVGLAVDDRLAKDDYPLVNDIAAVSIGESVINFYSFASKFCSHHKPSVYPIYDSFVESLLIKYKNKDNFDRFAKDDLKHYEHFVEVLEEFRRFYGLTDFGLRDIDRFLWLAGKDWFPKSYRRSTRGKSQPAEPGPHGPPPVARAAGWARTRKVGAF